MAIAKAKIHYNFGFSSLKENNVDFITDELIVFPSGTCCVLINIGNNTQKNINSGSKAISITALSVSLNKKFLAFAEKNNTTVPEIYIYDAVTYRKACVLSQDSYPCEKYDNLDFSQKGKILSAVSFKVNKRELFVWQWDREQMIGYYLLYEGLCYSSQIFSAKFCHVNNGIFSFICPNRQIIFSCKDFMLNIVTENDFLIEIDNESNKQNQRLSIISQAWLDSKTIVLGTTVNSLVFIKGTRIFYECDVCSFEEGAVDSHDKGEDMQVRSIVSTNKGKSFWCSCGNLTLHHFELIEEEVFLKTHEIKMMSRSDLGGGFASSNTQSSYFTSIALSPSDSIIIGVTDNGQIFSYNLKSELKWYAEVNFTLISPLVHTDIITGMDVCVRKPYVATCSLDSTIKIWDYNDFKLIVSKLMSEPLLSITLHPRGHMLIAGTTTNLMACNIFSDDIQMFKSLPVPACFVCCFSHGGHMFAVARMNIVEIYSSLTFHLVSLFKTHLDTVRSMCWTENDGRIVSAGRDGAIYEWEVLTGKRYSENVLKGCNYSSIVLKNKSIFAIGAEHTIKEIVDSQIIADINCGDVAMTQITMANNGNVVFVGLENGKIRSLRFPLVNPPDWVELHGHCSAIKGLKVTCDDDYLISISQDTLCLIWKITGSLENLTKVEKPYTMEILVMPTDVERKVEMINSLQLRIEELQSEIPYQVLQKDISYNEALSQKMENYFEEVEILKEENSNLSKDLKNIEESYAKTVVKVRKKYSDMMQAIETQIKQVLMTEFGKYQELKDKDMRMKKEYRRKIETLGMKITDAQNKLATAQKLKEQKLPEIEYDFTREWKEMKKQVEEDNDTMVLNFINVCEAKHQNLILRTASLKVNNYTMKKHIVFLKKSIDENMVYSGRQDNETEKLSTNLKILEDMFESLKKSVLNKDKLIYEKEEVLNELRKNNQNLENSSRILEFKIQEATKNLELKQGEVRSLQNNIKSMESDLISMRKEICRLKEMNVKITEREKSESSKKTGVKKELLQTNNSYKRLNQEIFECTSLLHRHEDLKKRVQELIKIATIIKKEVAQEDEMDKASYCDFRAQGAHLKRTVDDIKVNMKELKKSQFQKDFNNMKKNSMHMNEIESLKISLKKSKEYLKELCKKFFAKRPEISWKQIQEILGRTVPSITLYNEIEELRNTIEINKLLIGDLKMENCYLEDGMSKTKVNEIYRKSRKIMIEQKNKNVQENH